MNKSKSIVYWIILITILVACAPDPETIAATVAAQLAEAVPATLTAWPTTTAYPTLTPAPTYTTFPTHTPYPTSTPRPTLAPRVIIATTTPTPMPRSFLLLEGKGDVVSENFEWQRCEKAVFEWEAGGRDNLIVHLNKTGSDRPAMLINEISPTKGQVLQPLSGGVYYLSVKGPVTGWTITALCLD